MNLYQLRYFVTLAETKHFGKAAERLCIAQPSLSHAIAQLEAELGVVLFERKNRSSTLTKEGMQFLSYVEKSLEILDNGIETMAHISRGEGALSLAFCVHWGFRSFRSWQTAFYRSRGTSTSSSSSTQT